MSLANEIECSKRVVGDCAFDYNVDPGDAITWEIFLRNNTGEDKQYVLFDAPSPFILTYAVTTSTTGGASFSGPFSMGTNVSVSLPANSSATVEIIGTTRPTLACATQITNCARVTEVPHDGCPKVKTIVSETVVIRDSNGSTDTAYPVGPGGSRSTDINQILYWLLGDECDQNMLMDFMSQKATVLRPSNTAGAPPNIATLLAQWAVDQNWTGGFSWG